MSEPCRICRAEAPRRFLRRDDVPVHQNLLAHDAREARGCPRGTLDLAACPACGFVANLAFDAALLRYGSGYENAQTHSAAFRDHLEDRCGAVERVKLDGRHVVEVGCGDGTFLRRLAERNPGVVATGFDPSHAGPESELDGRLRFVRGLFDPSRQGAPADVAICRHVIEHVADPRALLASIRRGLSPGGRVHLETPCIRWILEQRVVWDLFYEHCSYFAAPSLGAALAFEGFSEIEVEHVFGGQYLWGEAIASGPSGEQAWSQAPNGDVLELAQRFSALEAGALGAWREHLQGLGRHGRVALWGAGAKGVTLATLADADLSALDCLVDVNPRKQGAFVPGTGHPIVSPARAAERGVRAVVLMNPNYRAEVLATIARLGLPFTLARQPA